MIVSLLIFTKLFYPHQLKEFKKSIKLNNKETLKHKSMVGILWFSVVLLFLMFSVVPAMLIASNCSNNNIGHLILAFLFSDVYVFHYSIRKFVFRDGYCDI